jgi:putative ABC transport system ATP-binding protein
VRQNVALPVRLCLGRTMGHQGRTEEMLALFGLGALADRSPSQTSLAQQQRAAGARALVLTPQLILADEPSAHQDAAWVHDVFAALRQIAHDARAACLVATHDPEAIRYADRVLHLIDGELGERAW